MASGIYMIKSKINNKIYIGKAINIQKRWDKHNCLLSNNRHRNNYLQNTWNKYGEDNFEFSIIEECIEEDLNEREIYWIDYYKSCDPEYGYNGTLGGDGGKPTKETKQKISNILKAKYASGYKRVMSEETKRKISESNKGKKNSIEHIEKVRQSKIGKKLSKEHKQKISNSLKGRQISEEHRQIIIENNKTRIISEETKQKISKANKGKVSPTKGKKMDIKTKEKISKANKGKRSRLGKTLSEESKKKISESNKGKHNIKKGPMSEEQKQKISNTLKGKPSSRTGHYLIDIDTRRKICEDINNGIKICDIVKKYGISRSKVYDFKKDIKNGTIF